MSMRLITDGGYGTPEPVGDMDEDVRAALADLHQTSQARPDVAGDLGIDHVSEADAAVRGATSSLDVAVARRVLAYYTMVTGKVVSPANIDQAVADKANFAIAADDTQGDYQGDDAKDVAGALGTLRIKAAVDEIKAHGASPNATAVAELTQLVKSLQGQDSRAIAIEALSAPVQEVLDGVRALSPFQPDNPATPAQRNEVEHGLLALSQELASADDAARTDKVPRTSTQAALNGVENDLAYIDRVVEPQRDNSSVVDQFWTQHEQQAGASDASALF